VAASSSLLIEELTGRKRRLELRGTGLPFRGAAWGGSTVVATRWYPGNREATQHVLSAQEVPSEWEGVWRTTQLMRRPCLWAESEGGVSSDVVMAHQLAAILDEIRMDAQVLRVTWVSNAEGLVTAGRELRIVRVGHLTEVAFRYDTLDDVGWSATFAWSGRGEQKPAFAAPSRDMTAAIRSSVLAQEGVVAAFEGRLKAPPTRFNLGQLESMVAAPREILASFASAAVNLTARMRDLGNLAIQIRDTPVALLGQAADVANNAVAASNQFVDAISRTGPETWTTQAKLSSLTRTASYYGDAETQADVMAEAALSFAEVVRRRDSALARGGSAASGDALQVHLPRDGETWSTIAEKYYGDDLGAELARANGFPEYQVIPPRTPVIVPTRDALGAR
jgi:hypothetical protein